MTPFRYLVAPMMGALLIAPTADARVGCGATITSSTKLRADLVNCPGDGLVIGADRITLDLGRHTLSGSGAGTGIRLAGRRGVRITGGRVTAFATGIALDAATGNRVSGLTVSGVAGRAIDAVNGSDGNVFERLQSRGNRTGLALTDSERNVVRGGSFSDNAITGVLLLGASRNRVEGNRIAGNVGNGVAVVEGANDNAVLANAVEGSQTGLVVDAARGNLLALNRVGRSGDGILVAGDATTVAGNRVDRSLGGCEGCAGWGIGITAGSGNVVKANYVQRSFDDGIHVQAPSTWIGLNLALRNGDHGIEAVAALDGAGNVALGNANAEQCAGVRCLSRPRHGSSRGHRPSRTRRR